MSSRVATVMMVMMATALVGGCGEPTAKSAERAKPRPETAACELVEAPEVVRTEGAATLVRWDIPDRAVLFSEALPESVGYRAFREAIRRDEAELRVPIADRAPVEDEHMREVWRREDHNAAIVYEGKAGTLRPIHCLEALMFARQDARHSELTDPTEVIVLVLRKGDRLRIYAGASDQMFPPHSVYGIDEARADVADGWRFAVALHNHTIQHRGDRYALGAPTLSTNDIVMMRNLVDDPGLEAAWVTNGVYTAEIPAADFPQFLGADF